MAQNYENSIKIGITLQPQEEVKRELKSILEGIQKDTNIDLNLNTKNLEQSLKNLNNILSNLGNVIQNNLDFSKINTKNLTNNINKAVSDVNFDTLQTSLIEQFTEEAGIKAGEKVSDAFIKTVKKNWSSGEIQNILSDALALNEKNIAKMEKSLTRDFKTDELKKYAGFLQEINVLTEKLTVKGQTISLKNIEFSDDELKNLRSKFAKTIQIDDIKGIGIDKVMESWTESANKFGLALDGVIQDKVFALADIVAKYRDIKNNGVSTVSMMSSDDEEKQVEKITKAYFDLVEALNILDKQKDGIDIGIFNGDKEVQKIHNVEQALGGLGETTKKSLNVDNELAAFSKLEERANEIRSSVDSLAKVKYNFGDDGNLSSATITYTDNVGKVVTETMRWKEVTNEAQGTIQKGFTTTNVAVSENMQKIKQLKSNVEDLQNTLQNKLNMAKGNSFIDESVLTNLQNRLNAINTNTPEKELKELKVAITNLSSSESQIVRLQNAILKMTTGLAELKSKFGTVVDNKAKSELEAYKNQLQKLQDMIEKVSKGQKFDNSKISSELNNMTYASKNLSGALQGTQVATSGFSSALQSAIGSMGIYASTALVVEKSLQTIKEGFYHVIEVEDSLVNLRRVYDMTDAQASAFTSTIGEQAKALAMDTASLIDIVTMYKKLGYSIQESQSMAIETQKYNYAADINDIEASANSLVSTLKGFGMEASKITEVGDAVNQVSNSFALEAKDINTILQKSSATMHTFNNSLEETIALGTTAQEIMQDAATVGNALKSISARITTNSNALKSLESLGISIEDSNGRLKSTAQILTEVGEKWKSVGEGSEKASLANDLFGKNHISTGLAIIENYTQIDKVLNSISASQGAVAGEFATRMESTSAKIEQLKQSINLIWEKTFSSDFTKGLVEGVSKLVDVFGNLPSIISLATTALLLFKGQAVASAITGLTSFIGVVTSATSVVGTLGLAQIELNAIMAANPIGLIAIACTAAIVGVTSLTRYIDGATDRIVDNFDTIKNSMDEVKGLSTDLESLQKNIDAFNNNELDGENRQNFIDLNNQLVNEYPQLLECYDSEKQMFKVNQEALQELIKLKQENAMIDNAKGIEDAKKQLEDYQKRIENIKEKLENNNGIMGFTIDSRTREKMLGYLQEYQQEATKLSTVVNAGTQYINNYANSMYEQGYSTDTIRAKLQELGYDLGTINEAFKLDANNIDTQSVADKLYLVKNALTEIKYAGDVSAEGIEAFKQVFPALGINAENAKTVLEAFRQKINDNGDAISSMANAFVKNGSLTETQIKQLAEIFPELEINATNATGVMQAIGREFVTVGEEAEEAQGKVANLQEAFNGFHNEAELIEKVIDEMEKYGGITESTYGKILNNNNIIDALAAEGDAITNLTKLRDHDKKQMQEQIDTAFENAIARMNAEDNVFNNKSENDILRTESDAAANSAMQENASNTADAQSEAYGDDTSNFQKAANDKIGMHDDVNSALVTTSSAVVSNLGSAYGDDVTNFQNATNDKLSMLDKFKNAVKNAVSWVSSKLSQAVQAMKNFLGGGEDVTVDASGGDTGSTKVASDYAKKIALLGNSVKGNNTASSYSGGGSSKKASTPMVANPTKGSSSKKNNSGKKSDADKARKEAEKYAEKIQELQSNIDVDRYLDLNQALSSINNEMAALKTEQSQLMGMDYENSLIREIGLLESKKSALSDINDEQKREADELKNYLSQYGFYFDANGQLINSQQRLLEIQKATNAMSGNTEEALKKKQEWVDWIKE